METAEEIKSLFVNVCSSLSNIEGSQSENENSSDEKILIIKKKDDLDSLLNCSDNVSFKIRRLDISVPELSEIPLKVCSFRYLTDLNLSNMQLKVVPNEVGNLYNLVTLLLSENNLESLPKSLQGLTRLNCLNISHNNFTRVPCALYFGLRALKVLDLSYNKISTFNDPPACAHKLVLLNISMNALTELPEWVVKTGCHLKNLDVSQNAMKFSDNLGGSNGFEMFNSLQVLNLENCDITIKHMHVLSVFKNLEVLLLGNEKCSSKKIVGTNYFENVYADELKGLKHLKHLYLQNVMMGTLSPDFGSLQQLTVIDLSHNILPWLPEEFCDLTNLRILYLTSNNLYFLPRNIWKFVNLEQIHLANNNIGDIPEEMYNLKKLKFADFYNNKLEKVQEKLFCKLKNLQGIDLGLNFLDFSSSGLGEVLSAYECLKTSFRKFFGVFDNRCDSQKIADTCCDLRSRKNSLQWMSSSVSSGSSDVSDFMEALVSVRNELEEENWDNSFSDIEDEQLYTLDNDSNLMQQGDLKLNKNFCPGNFHVPQVLEHYWRVFKLNESKEPPTSDGQFDSE